MGFYLRLKIAHSVMSPRRIRPRRHDNAGVAHPREVVHADFGDAPRGVQLGALGLRQRIRRVLQHADSRDGLPKRRVDEDAALGDALGDFGAIDVHAVRLFVDAVDDGVDAAVEGVDHALRRGAVGGGVDAELVGFGAYGGQLVDVERRARRMASPRAAAGGGYLDEVRALFDELANGGATFGRACRLYAEVAQMPADNRDRPARQD